MNTPSSLPHHHHHLYMTGNSDSKHVPQPDGAAQIDAVEMHVERLCGALDDAHEIIRRLTRERDALRQHVDRLTDDLYRARQQQQQSPAPATFIIDAQSSFVAHN
eukprot:PhM_4_TR15861/c0_g1_i1/m.28026